MPYKLRSQVLNVFKMHNLKDVIEIQIIIIILKLFITYHR